MCQSDELVIFRRFPEFLLGNARTVSQNISEVLHQPTLDSRKCDSCLNAVSNSLFCCLQLISSHVELR